MGSQLGSHRKHSSQMDVREDELDAMPEAMGQQQGNGAVSITRTAGMLKRPGSVEDQDAIKALGGTEKRIGRR